MRSTSHLCVTQEKGGGQAVYLTTGSLACFLNEFQVRGAGGDSKVTWTATVVNFQPPGVWW